MPRPRRTKVASAKAAPVPAPATVTKATSSSARNKQESVISTNTASDAHDQAHVSDPESDISLASQGLKIASRRAVPRKSQSGHDFKPEETTMRGALRSEGQGKDILLTTNVKAKGVATPVITVQHRNGRTRQRKVIKRTTEDEKVLEDLKKRRDAALQAEKDSVTVVPNTQTSGEAADGEVKTGEGTESTLTLKDTTEDLSNGAVIVPSTPAVEASVVAIANFKRRPRQPSILRMVQQQHHQQHQPQDQDDSLEDSVDSAQDNDILGISEPEDESTPLPKQTATHKTSENVMQSSSSRKRKASEAVEGIQTRAPRSSPPVARSSPLTTVERSSILHSDSPSLPDPSTITRSKKKRPNDKTTLDISVDDSQAPPHSSSGEESSTETPRQEERSRTQRKAQAKAKPRHAKESSPSKKQVLTTAQLRNMLPRCQHRNAISRSSPFEIHSSSSALLELNSNGHDNNNSDVDELTLAKSHRFHKRQKHDHDTNTSTKQLSTNHLRRTYSQQHLSSDKENESGPEEDDDDGRSSEDETDSNIDDKSDPKDGNFRGGGRTQRKTSKGKPAAGKKQAKKNKSKALQDIDPQKRQQRQQQQHKNKNHQPSAELQSIAMKFKEIDNWEMSFEVVDADVGADGQVGTGSSPWR